MGTIEIDGKEYDVIKPKDNMGGLFKVEIRLPDGSTTIAARVNSWQRWTIMPGMKEEERDDE